MSRKVKSMFFVFVIASLVLTACGGGGGGGGGNEPIKVGAIFDLTGATGDVGTPYAEGVKGYVEWLNNNGGVEGHPIELISADYAYKVDVAEQLYTQYVSEGVVAFMGWDAQTNCLKNMAFSNYGEACGANVYSVGKKRVVFMNSDVYQGNPMVNRTVSEYSDDGNVIKCWSNSITGDREPERCFEGTYTRTKT